MSIQSAIVYEICGKRVVDLVKRLRDEGAAADEILTAVDALGNDMIGDE